MKNLLKVQAIFRGFLTRRQYNTANKVRSGFQLMPKEGYSKFGNTTSGLIVIICFNISRLSSILSLYFKSMSPYPVLNMLNLDNLLNLIIGLFILENGIQLIKDMEEVFKFGLMVADMKDTGKMTKQI